MVWSGFIAINLYAVTLLYHEFPYFRGNTNTRIEFAPYKVLVFCLIQWKCYILSVTYENKFCSEPADFTRQSYKDAVIRLHVAYRGILPGAQSVQSD